MTEVRCLSIRQPWASLIALGEKRIETRSWRTHFRGPLLIHASGTRAESEALQQPAIAAALLRHGVDGQTLPFGGIIAACILADCYRIEVAHAQNPYLQGIAEEIALLRAADNSSLWGVNPIERQLGNYAPGRWGWLLEGAQPFPRIPCGGQQGLWKASPNVLQILQGRGVRWQAAPHAVAR
jgi:hypothetical protein